MRRFRNPMEDCLRILTYFGGVAGLYVLYHIFQVAGSMVTARDLRVLLIVSVSILAIALIIIFVYLGVFLIERIFLTLSHYRSRKAEAHTPEFNEMTERLIYLEMSIASTLEGMERRLRLLEDKAMGAHRLYGYRSYSREEDLFVNSEVDPWALGEAREDIKDQDSL